MIARKHSLGVAITVSAMALGLWLGRRPTQQQGNTIDGTTTGLPPTPTPTP